MKSFRSFINEEVLPTVQVPDGSLDISKPAVRAAINAAIAGVVSQPAVTPYVVFNRLSKLLAQYHIILPKRFLEGDKGVEVFELRQFGHKMGMTDSGEFVSEVPSTLYLFLQYGIITPFGITYAKPIVGGMFKVTARIVDKIELDQLINMAEITMREEAECNQMAAKARAPKEPMHDITSDEKKRGNKEAVATSQKGLEEDKDPCWKGYEMIGMKKKGARKVPNCVPVKEEGQVDEGRILRSLKPDEDPQPTPAYAKKIEQEKHDKQRKKINRANSVHMKMFMRTGEKHWLDGMKEETQIDELSYETVARYHRKAAERFHTGEEPKEKREKGREMATRKRAGGMMGIPKAKVMAKEETQIDETSEKLRLSYINKAMKQSREGDMSKEKQARNYKRAIGIDRATRLMVKDKKNVKEENLDEKLTKRMSAGDVISDFVHSKDPKFKGKSKKERQKMALGAYYGMHPEKSKLDEVSRETLDSYKEKASKELKGSPTSKTSKRVAGISLAQKKSGRKAMNQAIEKIKSAFTPEYLKDVAAKEKKARESDPRFQAFVARKKS